MDFSMLKIEFQITKERRKHDETFQIDIRHFDHDDAV